MTDTNYSQMSQESEDFALKYHEFQEIIGDRYRQMIKAIYNIKEEVDKAESPYLGLDLAPIIDDSLTIVNVY